jgi:hypothetical protein
LNEFFAGVFCREDGPVPAADPMECQSKLDGVKITESKVIEKIRNLRPSSAAGPDNIGPGLLQNLVEEVAQALRIIFQRSVDEGEVPEDWRTANVTPIFKKRAKSDPGNCRPVSLTSVCCKVLVDYPG